MHGWHTRLPWSWDGSVRDDDGLKLKEATFDLFSDADASRSNDPGFTLRRPASTRSAAETGTPFQRATTSRLVFLDTRLAPCPPLCCF